MMRKVTDPDGVTYIVCDVIGLTHPALDWVQLNLCDDDGGPVRPEGGHSMPRYMAEWWMDGSIKVQINKIKKETDDE